MGQKNDKTSGAGEVQVFELTMDNPRADASKSTLIIAAGLIPTSEQT